MRSAFCALAAGMLMWPMVAIAEPSANTIAVNVDQVAGLLAREIGRAHV